METEWMNETSAEAPSVPAPEKTEKKKFSLKGFGGKKKKRWLKILIILVVVIAIVAGCVQTDQKRQHPTQQQLSGVHRHPAGSDGQRLRHRHVAAGGLLQRHHPALRRYRQRSL